MNLHLRAGLILVALSFATPAAAEDCQLKLLGSLDMQPVSGDDRILVPALVNGTEVRMLVDTGASISAMTPKTADALNLSRQEANFRLLNFYGHVSQQMVQLDTLQLGALKGKRIRFMIFPGSDHDFDGLIGGDMLKRYDVELDFTAHKVNLFSQNHCEGKVVYWPATAGTAVPFSMTPPAHANPANWGPLTVDEQTQIYVPVTLDGKNFTALIDTGATDTVLSAAIARDMFGITANSTGAIRPDGQDGGSFDYIFHKLSFGGIEVANPRITVHPDLIGTKDPDNIAVTGSMIMHEDDAGRSRRGTIMDIGAMAAFSNLASLSRRI